MKVGDVRFKFERFFVPNINPEELPLDFSAWAFLSGEQTGCWLVVIIVQQNKVMEMSKWL